jgi:leucine dehydrogenase
MNTTVEDMHVVARHTKNIFGTTVDPSPYTAEGVFESIKFTIDYFANDLFHGHRTLQGKSVLVQGLGKVGHTLIDMLAGEGAKLYLNDINQDAINDALKRYPDAVVVPTEELTKVEVDIFAPSAKGEVVTKQNVDDWKCKILCGAANNILQNSRIGYQLQERGVVYCPDYVANMGGVCSIQYLEIENLGNDICIQNIRKTVRKMLGLTFRTAFRHNLPFNVAVDHAIKKIIWGDSLKSMQKNNHLIFPSTSAAEPND